MLKLNLVRLENPTVVNELEILVLKLNWSTRDALIKLLNNFSSILYGEKSSAGTKLFKDSRDLIETIGNLELISKSESKASELFLGLCYMDKRRIIDVLQRNQDFALKLRREVSMQVKLNLVEENNSLISDLIDLAIKGGQDKRNVHPDRGLNSDQKLKEGSKKETEIESDEGSDEKSDRVPIKGSDEELDRGPCESENLNENANTPGVKPTSRTTKPSELRVETHPIKDPKASKGEMNVQISKKADEKSPTDLIASNKPPMDTLENPLLKQRNKLRTEFLQSFDPQQSHESRDDRKPRAVSPIRSRIIPIAEEDDLSDVNPIPPKSDRITNMRSNQNYNRPNVDNADKDRFVDDNGFSLTREIVETREEIEKLTREEYFERVRF